MTPAGRRRVFGLARALGLALAFGQAACGSSDQAGDGGSDRGPGDEDAGPLPDGDTPQPSWARIFEGGNQTSATAIVIDGEGNVYVAFSFDGSIRVGDETLTAAGATDGLVVKVSPAGDVLWRTPVGGAGADALSDLALDPSGDVWAIGRFEQSLAVATPPLQSLGASDVLLLRLAGMTGEIVFARGFGGSGADWGHAVAVAGDGRLALAGWFRDRLSLDDRLVSTDSMNWNGFLAFMPPAAVRADWARVLGGFGQDGISTVAIAPDGDLAATGIHDGATSFGCGQHTSTALSHAFVVRYTPDGACRFSKSYGQLGWNGAGAATFSPAGDLVVTGAFEGPIDFGGGETTSNCGQTFFCRDAFIVRLGPGGEHLWSHAWGDGTGDDTAGGVAFTETGELFTVGTFHGTIDFAGQAMPTAGGSDGFAVLLSAGGGVRWSTSVGGAGDDTLVAVAVEPAGIYLAGRAGGPLTTPDVRLLTSASTGGGLLVRLDRREGAAR